MKITKKELLKIIKESTDDKNNEDKIITFKIKRDYNNNIENMLKHIEKIGNGGHSFEIIVDEGDEDYEKVYYYDGDGGSRISDISVEDYVEKDLSESTFLIDPSDSNMQSKITAIKNNSTIYDKNKDEIKIKDDNDVIANKGQIAERNKKKKKKDFADEYYKAMRNVNREVEHETMGDGWHAKNKPHKNKKKYNRQTFKDETKDSVNENIEFTKAELNKVITETKYNGEIMSKEDIQNIILERKHNGTLFTKDELTKKFKNGRK